MIGARRLLAASLVILAALPGAPVPARGHALVLEAAPRSGEVVTTPPSRIFLRFNSRIEKRLSRITLIGPAGRPIPLPVAAPDRSLDRLVVPLQPLPPGAYLLRWKVLSADGHVTEGVLRFTVAPGP